MTTRIAVGDARRMLKLIPDDSINSVITSFPYWLKRDYHAGPEEIGREPTIQEYIDNVLSVTDEVHRVIMPHATFWLNLGDSYSTQSGNSRGTYYPETGNITNVANGDVLIKSGELPHKSLCLIPYRIAIAMEDRGWIIRNVVIWHKPDCMPESVQDRFTVDYEPVFLCTKNPNYYFKQQFRPYKVLDGQVQRKPQAAVAKSIAKNLIVPGRTVHTMHVNRANGNGRDVFNPVGANMRSVWTIPTAGYRGAHFAVFPEELVEICIEAGCPPGGSVLDPFLGSGTVAVVAERLGRNCYGIELNPEFAKQARERIVAARNCRTVARYSGGTHGKEQ